VALIPLNPPAAAVAERYAAADGPRILKLWHLASVDAPSVAVVWACALAWAAHVGPSRATIAALALVVWAIYVLDRLLDGRAGMRGGRNGLKDRHYFHWEHRKALAWLGAAGILAAVWLVMPHLARRGLRTDSAVAAAMLLYFGGVHGGSGDGPRMLQRASAWVSREFVVAAIFTAGCALPALTAARQESAAVIPLAAPVAALAALAWLNLRAIGRWENDAPQAGSLIRPGLVLAGLSITSAAALLGAEPRSAALLAMTGMSSLLLLLLDRVRGRLEAVTLRAAADLVLLTPLLLAGFTL
jgi:hypothetical protein